MIDITKICGFRGLFYGFLPVFSLNLLRNIDVGIAWNNFSDSLWLSDERTFPMRFGSYLLFAGSAMCLVARQTDIEKTMNARKQIKDMLINDKALVFLRGAVLTMPYLLINDTGFETACLFYANEYSESEAVDLGVSLGIIFCTGLLSHPLYTVCMRTMQARVSREPQDPKTPKPQNPNV